MTWLVEVAMWWVAQVFQIFGYVGVSVTLSTIFMYKVRNFSEDLVGCAGPVECGRKPKARLENSRRSLPYVKKF